MKDRTFGRRCGIVVAVGAVSTLAALPAGAESQAPGSDVLDGAPVVPQLLDQAQGKLGGQKPQAPAAPRRSAPGSAGDPQRSAPVSRASAPRRRSTPAGGGIARANASTASTPGAAGAGGTAASRSRSASTHQAGGSRDRSVASADVAPASTRPAATSPGSDVENRADLPFTGSNAVRLAGLGLLALTIGVGFRVALRRRMLPHA